MHMQTTRVEVKVANALVEHNIPFTFADHLSPLMRDVFLDSEMTRNYASAST